MNNQLKTMMTAAGYDFSETNRSYFCKAVNKCLDGGLVKIEVCDKGRVWVNKETGKKYNVVVKAAGWSSRRHLQDGVYTSGILRTIGTHLQIPQVKEKIKSMVSLHEHCGRCGGSGFIPQFNYYCDGICFECYGSGMSSEKDLVQIENK